MGYVKRCGTNLWKRKLKVLSVVSRIFLVFLKTSAFDFHFCLRKRSAGVFHDSMFSLTLFSPQVPFPHLHRIPWLSVFVMVGFLTHNLSFSKDFIFLFMSPTFVLSSKSPVQNFSMLISTKIFEFLIGIVGLEIPN